MIMDGFDIEVGDSVYDLIFGAGKVERLVPDENRFWVRFSPTNLRCFSNVGYGTFMERTLYWQSPIIMAPSKNVDSWTKVISIANAVNKALGLGI